MSPTAFICSAGKWSNRTGLFSDEQCERRCSAGKWSNQTGLSADDQCTSCVAGKYYSVVAYTGEQAHSIDICHDCPAGSFTEVPEAATECKPCAAGKYSLYALAVFEDSCKVCRAGFFSNTTGRNSGLDLRDLG